MVTVSIPKTDIYIQKEAQFQYERKGDTKFTIWKEKKISIELQISQFSEKDKFIKLHDEEINMARYINQNALNFDITEVHKAYFN